MSRYLLQLLERQRMTLALLAGVSAVVVAFVAASFLLFGRSGSASEELLTSNAQAAATAEPTPTIAQTAGPPPTLATVGPTVECPKCTIDGAGAVDGGAASGGSSTGSGGGQPSTGSASDGGPSGATGDQPPTGDGPPPSGGGTPPPAGGTAPPPPPAATPTPEPLSITIVSPSEGATVSPIFTVQIAVTGIELGLGPGGELIPGLAHWHVAIDTAPPGMEAFDGASGQVGPLSPGPHTITVTLNLNNADLTVVAIDQVHITVTSSGVR